MDHGPSAAGLRERKKSATREAIARAALELFDRDGFEHTTIPAIAAAADVSPRTVSAYFPAKEDLAFPDSAAAFERLALLLGQRPASETTADAMRDWFAGELAEWVGRDETARRRRRVIASDVRLQHYERRLLAEAEALLADAFAADLGQAPGALEPRMAAAATIAMFHVLGADRDAAIQRGEVRPVPSPADAMALLDRVLRFVGAGVSALQA
jgi:AcrR family transcriptional regulator